MGYGFSPIFKRLDGIYRTLGITFSIARQGWNRLLIPLLHALVNPKLAEIVVCNPVGIANGPIDLVATFHTLI